MTTSRLHGFLAGTRVFDLSRHLPGPLATLLLADMGAEVTKIESQAGDELRSIGPPGPNGHSLFFDAISALLARGRDGLGCTIDLALTDVTMPFQLFALAELGYTGRSPAPETEFLNGDWACYRPYRLRDGRDVALGAVEPRYWNAFCRASERLDWLQRHAETLPQHALIAELEAHFASMSAAECEARYATADCCLALVLDLERRPGPTTCASGAWCDGTQTCASGRRPTPRASTACAPISAVGFRTTARTGRPPVEPRRWPGRARAGRCPGRACRRRREDRRCSRRARRADGAVLGAGAAVDRARGSESRRWTSPTRSRARTCGRGCTRSSPSATPGRACCSRAAAEAMRIFDAAATRAALPFERLIPALRALFASGCEVPRRHVHAIGGMTSLLMPAWQAGRYYGLKVVNVAPGNAARGLPGLHGIYLLFDAVTGAPLAQIDGDEITSRRTAAASALAASMLARGDARHLLVVGAGRVARLLPEAYGAVLPIERVSVWARDARRAAAMAADLRTRGLDARSAPTLEPAARSADIVSSATLASAPVVHGAWLPAGSHLDLIGSFTPEMREADDDCFAGAGLWIDTEEALEKSGDLLGPLARGVLRAGSVRGTLAGLCRGEAPGRRSADERSVFKSVGTALEDLAAAILVHESAA